MNIKSTLLSLTTAALALSSAAVAAPIVLDFEGIGNLNPVGNFYAGLGVTFSPATLALVDVDAGGAGNFANEPSPNTVMFFFYADNAILNYAAGFTTGFSFFYSSKAAASVTVWDDVDGTGNLLATLNLPAQHNDNCVGDPAGEFCNWTPVSVTFSGIAKSINFGGTADEVVFDDITIGSATPGRIPEPASLALLGLGLAGLAAARRRKPA